MRVVGYIRVSTKTQGEKSGPEIQLEAIQAWSRENDIELVRTFEDLGTSGAISPLQRSVVQDSIRYAKENDCEALVVDRANRWSRGGLDDTILSRAQLALDYHLQLYIAQIPFYLDRFTASLVLTLEAELARRWREEHIRIVTRGLRNARLRNWPNGRPGRPPKPSLTPAELDVVLHAAVQRHGPGLERLAHEISVMRHAYEAADPAVQDQRKVRETWLRRQLAAEAFKNPEVCKRLSRRWPAAVHPDGDELEGSEVSA